MKNQPSKIHHFCVVYFKRLDTDTHHALKQSIGNSHQHIIDTGDFVFAYSRRNSSVTDGERSKHYFVCGDGQDFEIKQKNTYLGNAVFIDVSENTIRVSTSLTGLPPLFRYEDQQFIIFSDTIIAISEIPATGLHFNDLSVAELSLLGKPINYKTLFKEIEIVPAGRTIELSKKDGVRQVGEWRPPHADEMLQRDEYLDKIIQAMEASVQRMDVGKCFLSLTAGLDSRTLFALLEKFDKLIPCVTITGEARSLDTMRAAQLCSSYNVKHIPIHISEDFLKDMPQYTRIACQHSGGLSSVEQASEIYFNTQSINEFNGRLSGNLGNQVGRSGTEGTGVRNASIALLNISPDANAVYESDMHWFRMVNPNGDILSPEFLLQKENLFAQIDNYSIGHHYMDQKSPYTDKEVLRLKFLEPPLTGVDTIKDIKLRDLKHRLLGQSKNESFQCKIANDAGGNIKNIPVNWGWRVGGTHSLGGVFFGLTALTDLLILPRINFLPGVSRLSRLSGLKGFSGFKKLSFMDNAGMSEMVLDTFSSEKIKTNGILKQSFLDDMVNKRITAYQENDITNALNIALATEIFDVDCQ